MRLKSGRIGGHEPAPLAFLRKSSLLSFLFFFFPLAYPSSAPAPAAGGR